MTVASFKPDGYCCSSAGTSGSTVFSPEGGMVFSSKGRVVAFSFCAASSFVERELSDGVRERASSFSV